VSDSGSAFTHEPQQQDTDQAHAEHILAMLEESTDKRRRDDADLLARIMDARKEAQE